MDTLMDFVAHRLLSSNGFQHNDIKLSITMVNINVATGTPIF
jgi:hypothetical protein